MTLPPPLDWREAGIGPGLDVPPERRVTRDNWRLWPFSRWAFQHTRELVPSREIRRSAMPRELPLSPVSFDGLSFDDGAGRKVAWPDFVAESYTDALLVLHRGRIVFETYLNGMTPETSHHLFSVTKSFVGLLAEMLIAERTIDEAALVTRYVPELAASGFADARVRDLLDMTDGVAFDEDYGNPQAQVHLYSASYWTPAAAKGGARETLTRLTQRSGAPGELFAYRTPVSDAVGWVIERAAGRRLADLFAERLWSPAGCADDGHFLVDTAGDEIAATGLNATLRDVARLALLILEGGNGAIPPQALASIERGGDRDLFARFAYPERAGGSYRSQWWISHDAEESIGAVGVYGQRVHLERANQFAFIRFGSSPLVSNRDTEALHRNAIAAVREMLRR